MRAVSAQVSASGLGISLLGMSFLSRLEGYSVRDGVLHLKE
jgi:predicted aspartyl protease